MLLSEIMTIRDELYRARQETNDQLCDYDTKAECTKKPEGFVEGEQTVDVKYLRRTNYALFNALNLIDRLNVNNFTFEDDLKKYISGITFKEGFKK